jgi:hypothetical protein
MLHIPSAPRTCSAGERRHVPTATKGRLIAAARTLRLRAMAGGYGDMTRRGAWLVLLGLCGTPAEAMPSHVAVSAGSFFAAATRCEMQDFISQGQTKTLRAALSRYLSPLDQNNIEAGYARGLQDSTVYVVELKRWAPFTPDAASCYRVQGVLDDYRGQLDAG